ncbi:MAG: hypothetical protein COA79_11585 [Planctomycetota bacterium]|nr:MAG: hypothetical protein COA79_11585 [Planctomycetota bacterium]
MGKITKTLIIVQLIASVAFCFVSLINYATRTKWKAIYEEEHAVLLKNKESYDKAHEENKKAYTTLQIEKVTLTQERDKHKSTSDERLVSITDLNKDVTVLKDQISKHLDTISTKDNKLTEIGNRNKRLIEEVKRYKSISDIARNNEADAINEAIRMQTINTEKALQIEDIKKQLGKTNKSLEEKDWIIKQAEKTMGKTLTEILVDAAGVESTPLKAIAAKVVTSIPNENLVMLSVGKADGVKVGYKFTIYRGGNYIGKVEVIELWPNMASTRVLVELNNDKGLTIENGDEAKTQL